MASKMLIDATHPEETRVVVLRGNRVEEFDFESASRRQLRGNIYLAKVTRVEPSLQAAFIDYGGNRHGFLAFSEIHPDYYQIPVADRQALIDEEERAHRAAEVEADRRAAARTAHSVPANRSERGRRIASEPETKPAEIAEAQDKGALAPMSKDDEDSSDVIAGERSIELASPDLDQSGEGREAKEGAPSTTVIEVKASIASEPPQDERPFRGASEESSGEAAEATGNPLPEETTTLNAEAAGETRGAARGQAQPAPYAGGEPTDRPLGDDEEDDENNEDEDDDEDDGENDHENEGDEDDENDDENAGDEEDDENEASATEDTVESVGGADALEEAQERAPRVRRQYKIQEVIRRRQIMLVQVVKEERGTKGAALTTYLSLAGRYSVLMPNTARGGGISRKITSPQDRNRLKEIAQELEVPEGMGVILRTAGALRTKTEIKRDFEYLLRMWEQVRDLTLKSSAPTLVYEEGSVVKRAIRDLYNKDIDEVIVAGEDAYREAREFMRMLMPSHAKNVKLYSESQPLLIRYGVESQLDAMFSPIVQLRSGGYIVLNQAEALVAIDVNSGRATREHHIEDTALKTNLEAAEEIARQLRLRDLAGLIVIDFIDMDEKRNNRAVERRLKECLKNDRARIQVGRISHFGLLEMSRQRIRTSVFESSTEKCPHCGGTGHVRSVASVSLQCLRMLEESLLRGATHNVSVRTGTEIALYMLNHKRAHLRELEQRFRITITVKVEAAPMGPQPFAIEKGEQVHSLEQARALASQPAALLPLPVAEEDEAEEEAVLEAEGGAAADEGGSAADDLDEEAEHADAGENGARRRRRRRRRGRRGEERTEAGPLTAETVPEHTIAHEDHDGGEGEEVTSAHPADQRAGEEEADELRRRRRRGRRGGRRNRRPEGEKGGAQGLVENMTDALDREDAEATSEPGGSAAEPDRSEAELPAGRQAGAGEAGPSTEDALPRISASKEQTPLSGEALGETGRPAVDETAPVAATDAGAGAQVERPMPEPQPVAGGSPRRRSTVREPVVFQGEGAGLASPEGVAGPETDRTVEPQVIPAPDQASEGERGGSRRTGWWARRLIGNKD